MFCRQDADMGPNNIQPFAPEFRKSTCATNCCTQHEHAGERWYPCTQCGINFSSVTFLSRHTGERLYICKHCAMNFSSDILLSRHIGERPYTCKQRGTPCMWNTQSSLIVNFGHKNKSKYFFYISQPHWLYGCMSRHESSQQMAWRYFENAIHNKKNRNLWTI